MQGAIPPLPTFAFTLLVLNDPQELLPLYFYIQDGMTKDYN
jgi:hypothetical protein